MESKLTKYSMTEMNMQTITSAVTKKNEQNFPDINSTLCIMHVFTKMFCKILHQGYLSYIYTLLFTVCFKETKQKYN